MMDVVIVAHVGIAIIFDGQGPKLISVGEPGVVNVAETDIAHLLNNQAAIDTTQCASIADARKLLCEANLHINALTRTLSTVDSELPIELRARLANDANALLSNHSAAQYVTNVLSTGPFPDSADVDATITICLRENLSQLLAVLELLTDRQEEFRVTRHAWQSAEQKYSNNFRELQGFMVKAVRAGLFSALSEQLHNPLRSGLFLSVTLNQFPIASDRSLCKLIEHWLLAALSAYFAENGQSRTPAASLLSRYIEEHGTKSTTIGGYQYLDLTRDARQLEARIVSGEPLSDLVSHARFLADVVGVSGMATIGILSESRSAF